MHLMRSQILINAAKKMEPEELKFILHIILSENVFSVFYILRVTCYLLQSQMYCTFIFYIKLQNLEFFFI